MQVDLPILKECLGMSPYLMSAGWMIFDLPDNQEKDPRNILLKAANQIKPFNQLRKKFKNCLLLI